MAIAILLIAALLRFFRFTEFVTFLGDQGRDAIIVRRIVTLEHLPAIGPTSSIGGMFLGPFFYYFISPFLLLFNFDPVGLAFSSALFSLVGMAVSYVIIKKLADTMTALLFLVFVCFSSVQIDFARSSWNPNLLPVFSFVAVYLWYKFISSKNTVYPLLFGAVASICMQLHYLTLFLLAAFILMWVKEILVSKEKITLLKKAILAATTFIFFYAPLILFDLKHDFLNTRAFIRVLTNKEVVTNSSSLTRILETNSALYEHMFKFDVNQYVALAISAILFIFVLQNGFFKKKSFLQINTFVLFFYIFAFSLLNSFRHPHYYTPIYYSFFFIFAYCLSHISEINKGVKYAFIAVFMGVFIYLNASTFYFFKNHGSNQINIARTIAQSLLDHKPQAPYQIVPIPFTETDGHIRYFLEVAGNRPLPEESGDQPKELYILCYEQDCSELAAPQWQIASFKNATISATWNVDRVKIYKVVHKN